MSAKQRTLLPYRLHRELCAELIREEVLWQSDTAAVDEAIERVVRSADWQDGHKLYVILRELMNSNHASVLVDDLLDACKAVWLFEREWMFPHGFALVLRKKFAGGAR